MQTLITKQAALDAVAAEVELPDSMPDNMWEDIRNNRYAATQALRIAVKLTKKDIANRISKL